nr:P-loop NTPase fold protein [uncultured Draconibacterium sp.]
MEGKYDFSSLNEAELINVARDVLQAVYKYNFAEEVVSNGLRPDLVELSLTEELVNVLVEVKGTQEITASSATQINKQLEKYIETFNPKKVILLCFSNINFTAKSLLFNTFEKIKFSNYEIFELNWILEQFSKNPILGARFDFRDKIDSEAIKAVDFTNKMHILNNSGKNFFALGHIWGEQDQMKRFLKDGIWENGHENKLTNVVRRIKSGDIVFLQSSYSGYMRVKVIGVVSENIGDGHKILVNWHRLEEYIDIPNRGAYRSAISQIGNDSVPVILYGIYKRLPEVFDIFSKLENDMSKTVHRDNTHIGKADDLKGIQYWWLNFEDDTEVLKGSFERDNRLYIEVTENNIAENYFYNIDVGDQVVGCVRRDSERIKFVLEITEKADRRILPRVELKVIQQIPIENQVSFAEIKDLDLFKNSDVVTYNNNGRIFKLSEVEFQQILFLIQSDKSLEPIKNGLIKVRIDNDGAYTTRDLLDIENDVRSFALLLAAKDIKPPLAIALFGKWGSGKSFFMEQLSIRVDELASHQTFLEPDKDKRTQEELANEHVFCKGIVQIKFNAWSYLDANLWAGLVSSIFEKLDEYISQKGKGDAEIIELRNRLTNNLEIFANEKILIQKEKQKLENEKASFDKQLLEHKASKEALVNKIAKTKLSDIVDEIVRKSNISSDVKTKLEEYGISKSRIDKLSPAELFNEVKSWSSFIKNLLHFSWPYTIGFVVAGLVLLFVWVNPSNLASNFFQDIGREITAVITLVGPLFLKFYNSFSKYKKIIAPITDYKNKFNRELEAAKFKYEQDKELLELHIKEKEIAISEAESKIEEIDKQIDDLGYTLKHFVAKRAFNSFIKQKVANKEYDAHTGIISIIRKDFEQLSNMFQHVQEENGATINDAEGLSNKRIDELFLEDRVLDRIILYIDDLDRCSDEKVLEVIQAVHLLMAFPLFNVVVGVDKRCVHNALVYRNLLQYQHFADISQIKKMGISIISPSEYLEKIFQIPFQLKDPEEDSIKGMVDALLKDQIEEASVEDSLDVPDKSIVADSTETFTVEVPQLIIDDKGVFNEDTVLREVKKENKIITPDDLKLSPEELSYLREFAVLVGSVPRAIKRFINIYRIIRAHQDLDISSTELKEAYLSIMFLVAINIGQFKDHSKYVMEIIKTNSSDTLQNDNDSKPFLIEIWNLIEKSDLINDVLGYSCASINKYEGIVNRFSFGCVENDEDLKRKEAEVNAT